MLFIALAAASILPIVSARSCYYDRYGYYRCSGLSAGARIGIGIGIFVLGTAVLCLLGWQRRKRIQRINKAYTTNQPEQGTPYQPQGGYGVGGGPPAGWQGQPQPQYPPETYQQQQHTGGFAPPPGPPPQGNYDPNGPPQYAPYTAPGGKPPGGGYA